MYTIQLEKRVDQLSALLKRVDDLEKAVKKGHLRSENPVNY